MSEPEESSYYEIALTSRQVLSGFIILLVCMGAAFFSGLWAGRGSGAVPPPPVEGGVAQQDPDAGLEEFRFFSDEEEGDPEVEEITPAPKPSARTPQPSKPAQRNEPQGSRPQETSTLAQDVDRLEPPPSRQDTAPPRQEATPDAKKASEPPPRRDPRREASPPKPRVVPEEPPEKANPAIPRTTARRPDNAVGEFIVQVFSTHDETQARKVLRRLLDGGFSAFLSPVEVDDRTMYRVRVGPFADRPAAEKVGDRIQRTYRLEIWITNSR